VAGAWTVWRFIAALGEAGIEVAESPTDMGTAVQRALAGGQLRQVLEVAVRGTEDQVML